MDDATRPTDPDLSRREALRRCGGYLAGGALGALGLWLLGRSVAASGCDLPSPCGACGLRADCPEQKAVRYREEVDRERR